MQEIDIQTVTTVALSLAAAYGISKLAKSGSRDSLLPPGPPTLPFLGNLASLPMKDLYIKFTEWAQTYGGVYSVKIRSETIIVVTSLDGVDEIMEKNGALTASRPDFAPIIRFSGPGRYILFAPYGAVWRKFRKVVADLLRPAARQNLNSVSAAEVSQLLFEIQQDPENLYYHIHRYNASLMFSVIAGQRIPQVNSSLCKEFFHTWDMISEVCEAGNAPPVDLFPILDYIPDRFARNWKSRCEVIRGRLDELIGGLIDKSEKRLASEKPNGCYLEAMLEKAKEYGIDNEGIRSITGAMIFGGATTPASAVQFLILITTAFPEFQQKVHEELDRVIGDDRAPTMDDLPNLPYLTVFIREVYRFRPLNSLLAPHYADEDQFYRGKLIPKDSTIFLNIWGICHDPELFDEPETFDPDRFIRSPYGVKPEAAERMSDDALKRFEALMFGAGRRRCPAMPIAIDSLAFVSASLLWAFDFSPLRDEQGKEIKPDLGAWDCGLTNIPRPFKVTVKPRSNRHTQVIKQNYATGTPIFEAFEVELSDKDKVHVQNVRKGLQPESIRV